MSDAAKPSVWSAIRMPVIIGGTVLVLFVGFGGFWAGTAKLSGAAIAPGVVSPDGLRRTVQHLEGGIIHSILVSAGDTVQEGQPLIVMEETQALAEHRRTLAQQMTYSAMESRLTAEQSSADRVEFPDWMLEQQEAPNVREVLETQLTLFRTRQAANTTRELILRQRIAQLDEEVGGLEAQAESQRQQIVLIASELEDVQELVDLGLERRARLLALQRQEADIRGNLGSNLASIARAQQAVGETELQIVNLEVERQDSIANELNQVRFEQASIEQDLRRTEDVLSRTTIIAPISGIIVQSRFTTTGGVIRPGEPIMDIVPLEEDLLIDAQVSPTDIDSVEPGMIAQVILSAYSQRNLPRFVGRVRSISADRLIDEATGLPYFLARVEVDPAQFENLNQEIVLSPGMPAEVYILTGERTALEYFLEPWLMSFRRAFREV